LKFPKLKEGLSIFFSKIPL